LTVAAGFAAGAVFDGTAAAFVTGGGAAGALKTSAAKMADPSAITEAKPAKRETKTALGMGQSSSR
jgi:hypothetical protein